MTVIKDTADTTTEVVDTSTNEETQDTEVSLEDDDFSFDDAADGETEESEESTEDEAATESDEETDEESEDDEGTQSQDDETKEEDTTSEEDKKSAAQEAFQQREADRKAKQEAQQALEVAQQDYLADATDDENLALRQLQVDAYNNRVEGNLNKLENGIEKAVATIDLFQTGSAVVKKQLASSLDDFEARFVIRDSNGQPVQIKIDPATGQKADVYKFLQSKAESIRELTGDGARQQQSAKKSAKARTDTIPTRTPKEPKIDPDLAAFDEEAARR